MRRMWPGGKTGAWALGLAAYACGLIACFPATWMDHKLGDATNGTVRIADAQGTLWSGSGSLEIRDQGRRIGPAQGLSWRLQPGDFLRGRLAFSVKLESAVQPMTLSAGWSGGELGQAAIQLPAAIIGLAVPRLSTLDLGGELLLKTERLKIGSDWFEGDASVVWQHARSGLTSVSPLGSYAMDIKGNGMLTSATLRTLQGPLQLDGQGSWAHDRSPVFSGHARVPPALRQQLDPLLRLITVERGAGNFEIQFR